MTTVSYQINDFDVQRMLMAVEMALTPVGLSGFLNGWVDPYLRGRAAARFEDEGDDVTGPWAPLSPATQGIRDAMGYGAAHPINVRTGELLRYITQEEGNAHPTSYGAELTLPGAMGGGELEDKLEAAQAGGVSDYGTAFPARPVLGMNETDLAAVIFFLGDYIERAARV